MAFLGKPIGPRQVLRCDLAGADERCLSANLQQDPTIEALKRLGGPAPRISFDRQPPC